MTRRGDTGLVCAALAVLVVASTGILGAVQWIDRPFPGFLVLDNRVVASAGLSHWGATQGGYVFDKLEGQPNP